MNKLYIAILCFLFIAGCKKKEQDPVIPAQTPPISFGGITVTDVNGVIVYDDSTDWRVGDTWTAKEDSLFVEKHSSGCALTQQYQIAIYPNPCRDIFAMWLNKPVSSRLALRLVDRNYQLLRAYDSLFYSNTQINLDSISLEDTVRMYYKFIDGNCEFRGHGDILINQDL